jgi:hypothetical protein
MLTEKQLARIALLCDGIESALRKTGVISGELTDRLCCFLSNTAIDLVDFIPEWPNARLISRGVNVFMKRAGLA